MTGREPAEVSSCGTAGFSNQLAAAARRHWRLSENADAVAWCAQAGVALAWREQLHAGHYTPGTRALITLRARLHTERVAFILGHELGHHFLAQCRTDARLRSALSVGTLSGLGSFPPGSDDEEEICDRFAAALLLDPRRARLWVDHSQVTIDSLWNFATYAHLDVRHAHVRIAECTDHRATLLQIDTLGPGPTVTDAFGPLASKLRGAVATTSSDLWQADGYVTVDWLVLQEVVRIVGTLKRVGGATAYLLVTRCGAVL